MYDTYTDVRKELHCLNNWPEQRTLPPKPQNPFSHPEAG